MINLRPKVANIPYRKCRNSHNYIEITVLLSTILDYKAIFSYFIICFIILMRFKYIGAQKRIGLVVLKFYHVHIFITTNFQLNLLSFIYNFHRRFKWEKV